MLLSLVDDWNTVIEHSKRNYILGQPDILRDGRESRLIMILNEVTEQCCVLACGIEPLNVVRQLVHGSSIRRKSSDKPVVDWIVECSWHVVLPLAKSVRVAIEDFTYRINS